MYRQLILANLRKLYLTLVLTVFMACMPSCSYAQINIMLVDSMRYVASYKNSSTCDDMDLNVYKAEGHDTAYVMQHGLYDCEGTFQYINTQKQMLYKDKQQIIQQLCFSLIQKFRIDSFTVRISPGVYGDLRDSMISIFSNSPEWNKYLSNYKTLYHRVDNDELTCDVPFNIPLTMTILNKSGFRAMWQAIPGSSEYRLDSAYIPDFFRQDFITLEKSRSHKKGMLVPDPVLFLMFKKRN